MRKNPGASQSTTTACAEATTNESQTLCADLRCISTYGADILVEKPSEQHKRAEKLTIDLRKSKKKELIKSKR